MMNEDLLVGLLSGIVAAFLFWLASRGPKRERNTELDVILQSNEHKVKGRFD